MPESVDAAYSIKFKRILLFFVMVLAFDARLTYAMSPEDATHNLTVIEWAYQEADFCKKQGFHIEEKLSKWMKLNSEIYSSSISEIEGIAKRKGLSSKDDISMAVISLAGEIRRDVSKETRFTTSACLNYKSSLERYSTLLKQ